MKVSYQRRWDEEGYGTCYDQAISMALSEMANLQLAIVSEIAMGFPRIKEYDPEGKNHAEMFLKPLRFDRGATQVKQGKAVIYLTLTQRRFIELFLPKGVRKKIKDRNTAILIK